MILSDARLLRRQCGRNNGGCNGDGRKSSGGRQATVCLPFLNAASGWAISATACWAIAGRHTNAPQAYS
jgi:hypothetical protein